MRKSIQLLIIFILIFPALYAQQNLQQKNNLDQMKKLLNQNLLFQKNLKGLGNANDLLAFNTLQEPKFLFENEKGKVYVQPLDNMRFLSSTFHSNMPVKKDAPRIYIPNAIRRR